MLHLDNLSVVITGASSGIGRATAYAFAEKGALLTLAGRNEGRLREVARDCQRLGATVLTVPTDVTSEVAVQQLVQAAVENFRHLDVWVNNAAVTLFGRLEETPMEDFRRVIETNLLGYVHGARAALPYFRKQGGGVLINVASIAAKVGQPYTSAYVTSKHAVRALGMCLRQENANDKDIHICTVMPASIDTPIFQHAANYTGRAIRPIPPVYKAELVARTIVRLTVHPRREVFVGRSGRLLNLLNTIAPAISERLMRISVERSHFEKGKRAQSTAGNLYKPMQLGYRINGGWKSRRPFPTIAILSIGLAISAAVFVWRWARRAEKTKIAA